MLLWRLSNYMKIWKNKDAYNSSAYLSTRLSFQSSSLDLMSPDSGLDILLHPSNTNPANIDPSSMLSHRPSSSVVIDGEKDDNDDNVNRHPASSDDDDDGADDDDDVVGGASQPFTPSKMRGVESFVLGDLSPQSSSSSAAVGRSNRQTEETTTTMSTTSEEQDEAVSHNKEYKHF